MLALRDNPITSVLTEAFTRSAVDGVWYPRAEPQDRALVRVHVAESGLCVERRRSLGAPWAPIAVVHAAEFDPESFRAWARGWRLTV